MNLGFKKILSPVSLIVELGVSIGYVLSTKTFSIGYIQVYSPDSSSLIHHFDSDCIIGPVYFFLQQQTSNNRNNPHPKQFFHLSFRDMSFAFKKLCILLRQLQCTCMSTIFNYNVSLYQSELGFFFQVFHPLSYNFLCLLQIQLLLFLKLFSTRHHY